MPCFEWDPAKSHADKQKHGVPRHVFEDPDALADHDRVEGGERRWQTLGMVGGALLLLVAHTIRLEGEGDEVLWIISARRADRKEKQRYEEERQARRRY
jgi:uncharacterized protein